MNYSDINTDKNLFSLPDYPLVTVYDDNFFVRNDYDVLSRGQRNYLVQFFLKQGFKQKTGKTMVNEAISVHFPIPQSNLAVSGFEARFLTSDPLILYCVTPTQFAEVIFYDAGRLGEEQAIAHLQTLIQKCPYNIEWLRDISFHSEIETLTAQYFNELMVYQREGVENKFKRKKAL